MPDVYTPAYPTRLQLASANQIASGLDKANAQQKSAELFSAMDDMLRAMKALQACGASADFLHDCAAGLRDQVSNISHAIDVELDDRAGLYLEPLDLSELDAFMKEVGA